LLGDLDHVVDTSVESLFVQASLVLKADRHVGAKPRHLEEVDLLFSYDLRHHEELRYDLTLVEFDRRYGVTLVVELNLRLDLFALSRGLLLLENVEGKATSRLQNLIDNELVLLIRIPKVNMVRRRLINMSFVVITVFDGLLRLDDLSDINCCRTCARLEVIVQQLQLVAQITRDVNLVVEAVDLLFPLLDDFFGFLLGLFALVFLLVVFGLVGDDDLGLLLL